MPERTGAHIADFDTAPILTLRTGPDTPPPVVPTAVDSGQQ
ncbi:hypothetical protein [Mycolicibacterium confluentis]|nr:hypothetical protein [Mycolicibacterium confluentis]